MTVITDTLTDLAGEPEKDPIFFSTYAVRDSVDGTAIITTTTHQYLPINGVITTGNLQPGPARVRIGVHTYAIEIPEWATPIRLMPLIEAGLPVPPGDEIAAVRNGGGVARIQALTEDQYAALTSTDPATLYIVVPNP
ncbi:phage upper tail fiber protein [Nocardia brasiliensis]|uniref:phage upper tail fiber protein n=1 Tax=Nocardia brasiliensis TaxID=37326 RepID=UPI00245616FB|nr:hypothetical protein [Nocardia brasiliensis]